MAGEGERVYISYVSTDGVVHVWEAANRGSGPVCGSDVFYLTDQPPKGEPLEADGCWDCAGIVYSRLQGLEGS